VHLSSIGAYGAVDTLEGPIDQARPPEPTYLYGISKWSAERVASGLAELLRVELDIVRLSSVYGPFEYESGDRDVMSPHLQMLRAAIDGVSLRLSGVLRADWIYSRDVAAAILRASEHDGLGGQTFNIGGDVVTDLFGWGAPIMEDAGRTRVKQFAFGYERQRAHRSMHESDVQVRFEPGHGLPYSRCGYTQLESCGLRARPRRQHRSSR
jgi:nucleoside-diphosphate-sugar epimerase